MPNPKRRHSRSRRDKRRAANWKLEISSLSKCPNCQTLKKPHHVCPACGFYRGKVVVPVKDKTAKEPAQK